MVKSRSNKTGATVNGGQSRRQATADPAKIARKRVSEDCDLLKYQKKKAKTQLQEPDASPHSAVARVSMDSTTSTKVVPLETIRKLTLGQRLARTLAPSSFSLDDGPYCFGKIISVIRGETIDDDLYRVAYDDGGCEDLNSLTLYDALLLYEKIVPFQTDDTNRNPSALADYFYEFSPRVNHFHSNLSSINGCNVPSRVAQRIGKRIIFGTVMENIPKGYKKGTCKYVWSVEYDNGDTTKLDDDEFLKASKLYQKHETEDPAPISTNIEHFIMHEEFKPFPSGLR